MKRFTTIPILILTLCATALSQTPPKPDVGTFELTPIAPPTPALKYQLLFDDALDRRPGNARFSISIQYCSWEREAKGQSGQRS